MLWAQRFGWEPQPHRCSQVGRRHGTLNIGNDGLVQIASVGYENVLKLFDSGIVNLNGGTLSNPRLKVWPGSEFNWTSGTLIYRDNLKLEADELLGADLTISSGQTLEDPLNVTVGETGSASLSINGTGRTSVTSLTVGAQAGSSGVVTVDGSDATLEANSILVGNLGSGRLTVNHSAINNNKAWIGRDSGSLGTVTLVGPETFMQIDWIGMAGDGTLDVLEGATVQSPSNATHVAEELGSTGTVRVEGDGSHWQVDGEHYIGYAGMGRCHDQRWSNGYQCRRNDHCARCRLNHLGHAGRCEVDQCLR